MEIYKYNTTDRINSLISYIDSTWTDISNDFYDIKSQKFEQEYLLPIKEKCTNIANDLSNLDKKILNLEKYILDNTH